MVDEAILRDALAVTLERTRFDTLGVRHEGKVRDSYTRSDGTRVLVTTDRISAFDRVLGTLPLKGQVLSRMATFWFERTGGLVSNHWIASPDPAVTIARECVPLPLEVVVRAYLTGVTSTSIWTAYERGAREFCGHPLPEGLRKNDPLPHPIVTPSTKPIDGTHDVSTSGDALVEQGVISRADFEYVRDAALALFAAGTAHCASRGIILADTKYEFGRAPDGTILLIDEIHTPDSSRFWFAESYAARIEAGEEPESFDKEYVRRWLAGVGFRGEGVPPVLPDAVRIEAARRYVQAYERVLGIDFVADLRPPIPRIAAALGLTIPAPAAAGRE